MTEQPKGFDWSGAHGEAWRANLRPMEAMLSAVNDPLIDALDLDRPMRVADIGCGGGGLTSALADRAPIGSTIHGTDISPALIEHAQSLDKPKDRTLSFEIADMQTATTAEPFDRLTSRFGVMFFSDPALAFANIVRWLSPGGKLVFAVWGPPDSNPWMTLVRDTVSAFIETPRPDPEGPGPFRYADPTQLVQLLGEAGLDQIDVQQWQGSLKVGGGLSAGDAAAFALRAFSIAKPLIEEPASVSERALDALATAFSTHLTDGAVDMPACVHLVSGKL
ncbi:MAG: class I SAM-dependent methyltransferase [Pseudomonadota bacterium]